MEGTAISLSTGAKLWQEGRGNERKISVELTFPDPSSTTELARSSQCSGEEENRKFARVAIFLANAQ